MDEDVALVRIVIFSGIPGLAISGVDISGFGIDLNCASSVLNGEGIAGPLFGAVGLEGKCVVIKAHSSKALHDCQPSAAHGRDVEAVAGVIIVVIKIQVSPSCRKV